MAEETATSVLEEWSDGDEEPTIPFWADDSDSWDICVLGGFELPGLSDVKTSTPSAIDKKKPTGGNGATLTFQGEEPCPVEIKVRIWTRTHWAEWVKLAPFLRKRPGKGAPEPFDIGHPKTAFWKIRSVLIEDRSGPDKVAPGVYEITLKCIEYFPPAKKSATSTPKSSQGLGDIPTAFGNGKAPIGPPLPPSATKPTP